MSQSTRFNFDRVQKGQTWAQVVASDIISAHPDTDSFTTAAGISPSGVVHFGNFRDVVTAHLVREELTKQSKKAKLLFSWDNFDRFRKVPSGVPESFAQYIGMPLSKIPDPYGELSSYAERFQLPFVEAMSRLGIDIEYRDQTVLHEAGTYDSAIFHALSKREEIADILLSFMTEKAMGEKGIDPVAYRENYYPISVYSRFTGKDSTKVLNYDGATSITYLCTETKQTETVDLSVEHITKLAWKIDWPMRWKHEGVVFEPGGHDHASPGGSFDVASVISSRIFESTAPMFVEYKFVGIQGLGAKMSGSKGNAISPLDLLDIYEPDVLKNLYFKKSPEQSFELAFNSDIYRQYDEYDAEHAQENAIPFRQMVSFGQIVQWQEDKLAPLLEALDMTYSAESIARRLPLAKNWLLKYNPDEAITLNAQVNSAYVATMTDEQKARVAQLREELMKEGNATVLELETLVYNIPKEYVTDEKQLKLAQKSFFADVYNLLIGKSAGPRLGTFLWAVDRETVLKLLAI